MNVDDMIAAVALGFESAVNKLGLVRAAGAPAVPKPAAKAKRKGNPEALRKWRESQKAAPVAVAEKPAKPAKKKAAKKGRKAAAESVKRRDEEAVLIGAVEIVEYTRDDGTPGIVLRPKGRARGVAFARGDYAAFCDFVNTFRKGETMDPIARKVKARIGG